MMLRFLLLICLGNTVSAQSKNYFQALDNSESATRCFDAHNIYDTEIVYLDSASGVTALKQLETLANRKNDQQLKIEYLALMGDFYRERSATKNALEYLKLAMELANKYGEKNLQAEVNTNLSVVYYYQLKNYPLAFEHMLRANNIIRNDIGISQYLYANRFLYDLGFMYYDFGNYPKAKSFMLDALKYPSRNTLYAISNFNTLGILYRDAKMYDSASFYFNKGIDSARRINHEAWIGIIKGNLGAIYFQQKKYDECIPLLKIDYELSIAHKQWLSAANALWTFASINLRRNNLKQAEMQLAEVYALYQKQKNTKLLLNYSIEMAKLCKMKNDCNGAFAYLDSAKDLQDEISKRKDAIVFSQAEQKIAIEQHLSDIKLLESENGKKTLFRNSMIVFALLLLIIAGQFMLRQQLKHKRNEEKLNNAKSQLNHYIESVKEKNLLIEQFQQEIEQLSSESDNQEAQKGRAEVLYKLKKGTILTEDDWKEFRSLFEMVYSGFFDMLKQKYPQLTQAEIRLLALIKLHLSKKEMAEMLGIAQDSINKTSQRIRKKVELQEHVQLEELVANL